MSPKKGTMSVGITSEPTIDFQGTYVSFSGDYHSISNHTISYHTKWIIQIIYQLVVEPTHLKNMIVKLGRSFPQKKYFWQKKPVLKVTGETKNPIPIPHHPPLDPQTTPGVAFV